MRLFILDLGVSIKVPLRLLPGACTCVPRLWHQLTLKLIEFLDHPQSKPYRVDVFVKFVRDFEEKLNQLRLVEMGVKVAKEIDSASSLHSF